MNLVFLTILAVFAQPRALETRRWLQQQRIDQRVALDAAYWDRDATAYRAFAAERTPALLARLEEVLQSRDDHALSLAVNTLRDLDDDALGPTLLGDERRQRWFLGEYLRRRRDPELESQLLANPEPRWEPFSPLVLDRPELGERLLRSAFDGRLGRLTEAVCEAALALPLVRHAALLRAFLARTRPVRDELRALPAACIMLGAENPRWAVQALAEVRRLPVGDQHEVSFLLAARGLLATSGPARAQYAQAHEELLDVNIEPWRPWEVLFATLAWSEVSGQRALWEAIATRPESFRDLSPMLLWSRSPEAFATLLRILWGSPREGQEPTVLARVVLLSAPDGGPSVEEALGATEVLQRVEQTSWEHALREVHRCPDAACLQRVIDQGTDEDAARAAVLAGPAALAALSPDASRALLRRMLWHCSAPWMSPLPMAVLATMRGCPRNLRGLSDVWRPCASGDGVDVLAWEQRRACGAATGATP
jgi:hypothetical protein